MTTESNVQTTEKKVKPTPTPGPDGAFKCSASGFHADPRDRTIFHECVNNGGGKFQDIVYHCGPGTVFDDVHHICKMP